MDIWTHSLLSEKKFGGKPEDYYEIHKFIDSSKLFYFHVKHRMLLHNTFGIEICIRMFGDYLQNSDSKTILVRDIAAEHVKEDLYGKVPTVTEWFSQNESLEQFILSIPETEDEALNAFIQTPYLQSNLKASLIITCSDFGVQLVQQIFGLEKSKLLREQIPTEQNVKSVLQNFKFTHKWQFTPNMKELEILKK